MIGDIELFCRERRRHAPDAPFVAITGTNGKSTTTALIAHLMQRSPATTPRWAAISAPRSCRWSRRAMGRVHVIEMSSYQIDLAPSLDPSVGILLNVSEDHIDRHGTLAHYAAVKERLVAGVQARGTAIVGVDDGWCRNIADRLDRAGKRVVRISVEEPAGRRHLCRARAPSCTAPAARTAKSRGWAASARCAACTTRRTRPAPRPARWRWASAPTVLQNGLRSFPGLAHRMEQVGRRGNVLFVNDSKGTNADAAANALSSFTDIFWIAGGKPKDGGIGLAGYSSAHPRRLSDRRGRAASFARHAGRARCPTRFQRHVWMSRWPMPRAMPRSVGLTEPVVLLSPACASFDQYRNFEIRGAVSRSGHRAARRQAGGVMATVAPPLLLRRTWIRRLRPLPEYEGGGF